MAAHGSVETRLSRPALFADAAEASRFLESLSLARLAGPVACLEETASTMDEAARRARAGASSGALVLAEAQTAGRGRRGARWECPARSGLLFSVVVRPDGKRAEFAHPAGWLSLLAAAAAARALGSLGAKEAATRWPNDILLGDRKCGGVLCEVTRTREGAGAFAVLGVGLNVLARPEELSPPTAARATSLAVTLGRAVERREVLAALLRELDRALALFAEGPLEAIRRSAAERSATLGREVALAGSDGVRRSGRAAGLDDLGRLVLARADGSVETVAVGGP